MGDDMDAMMADGLLRTVRDAAKLLYGENQTYPCDDVKRMMADVERLRAALREIAELNIGNTAALSVYLVHGFAFFF